MWLAAYRRQGVGRKAARSWMRDSRCPSELSGTSPARGPRRRGCVFRSAWLRSHDPLCASHAPAPAPLAARRRGVIYLRSAARVEVRVGGEALGIHLSGWLRSTAFGRAKRRPYCAHGSLCWPHGGMPARSESPNGFAAGATSSLQQRRSSAQLPRLRHLRDLCGSDRRQGVGPHHSGTHAPRVSSSRARGWTASRLSVPGAWGSCCDEIPRGMGNGRRARRPSAGSHGMRVSPGIFRAACDFPVWFEDL